MSWITIRPLEPDAADLLQTHGHQLGDGLGVLGVSGGLRVFFLQPMQTTQLESESLNNKPIRFKLNDQGKSGVLHAFRTSERVRVTILTEFRVSPDKFRHTFLLLNPCHLEKIEQDPENNGGFVLREPLRTESQGMSGN